MLIWVLQDVFFFIQAGNRVETAQMACKGEHLFRKTTFQMFLFPKNVSWVPFIRTHQALPMSIERHLLSLEVSNMTG